MGGNKSKPFVENAKTVLSRRQKLPAEEVVHGISKPISEATAVAPATATVRSPVIRLAPNVVDQGYVQDSTILKEMSTWDVVKTTNIKVDRPLLRCTMLLQFSDLYSMNNVILCRNPNMAMAKQQWHQWCVMRKNN